MQVWKFSLAVQDQQFLKVPKRGQLLCIQVQREVPCLWALVDPTAAYATVEIRIAGTGHELGGAPGEYVGTFQLRGGSLVFHVFAS